MKKVLQKVLISVLFIGIYIPTALVMSLLGALIIYIGNSQCSLKEGYLDCFDNIFEVRDNWKEYTAFMRD